MPKSGVAYRLFSASTAACRATAAYRGLFLIALALPVAALGGCADRADVRLGPLFAFAQKSNSGKVGGQDTRSGPQAQTAFASAASAPDLTPAEQAVAAAAEATNGREAGPRPSPLVALAGEEIPRGGGRYHVGKTYSIGGKWYQPEENPFYSETGLASWYGDNFHGRMTANGEVFDAGALTAAHPTLPLPSYVRVTNLANDRSVIVRVNDRGPFSGSRLIDVSERAADMLGFHRRGTAKVRVDYVERAPTDGDDTQFLLATYSEDRSSTPAGPEFIVAAKAPDLVPALAETHRPAASPIDAYTSAFAPAGTLQDSFSAGEVEAAYLFRSSYADEAAASEAFAALEDFAGR